MSASAVIVHLQTSGQAQFTAAMNQAAGTVQGVGGAAQQTQQQVDTSTRRMRKAWAGMAKGMAAMGGVAVAQKMLRDSVGGAVELTEQANKTSTVFGAAGGELVKWSQTSAKALGMSRAQALAAMGTLGNMLVPMGLAREKAAGMSKSVVTLAADLASFNNATPEQTLDALRSGLAGETEPLRKFGVFLNEARVKAEAMSMGIVKNARDTGKIKTAQMAAEIAQRKYNKAVAEHGRNSEQARAAALGNQRAQDGLTRATKGAIPQLTAAQKAQATLALIMRDTGDAQGDFARTSSSLANQQRVLKAQYANITASVGQALLPVLTKAMRVLSGLAEHADVVIPVVGALGVAFVAFRVATLASTVASMGMLGAVLAGALAVLALVAVAVLAYQKIAWFRSVVDTVRDAAVTVYGWLKANWLNIATVIGGPLVIAARLLVANWDRISHGAHAALEWFKALGRTLAHVFDALTDMAPLLLTALKIAFPFVGVGHELGQRLGAWAAGGLVARASWGVVGERGPELVRTPGRNIGISRWSYPVPTMSASTPSSLPVIDVDAATTPPIVHELYLVGGRKIGTAVA